MGRNLGGSTSMWKHWARRGAVLGSLALLGACGGSGGALLASFGDSLSDVGTYAVAVPVAGAGRFAVNGPGPRVWVEFLAAELGQSLTPNQTGGVTVAAAPPVAFPAVRAAGLAYAQGGARVDAAGVNQITGVATSSVSVREQVDRFVQQPARSQGMLMLMNGGGNDIAYWGQLVLAGQASSSAAAAGVVAAAQQMAAQALRLRAFGAVVVLNQADGALAPVAANPNIKALYQALTPQFNAALAQALAGSGVVVVDQFGLSRDIAARPSAYGLTNTTQAACRLDALPLPSAVACTDQTLVAPDAAATYQWADTLHGTPVYHRALASKVSADLRQLGLL